MLVYFNISLYLIDYKIKKSYTFYNLSITIRHFPKLTAKRKTIKIQNE